TPSWRSASRTSRPGASEGIGVNSPDKPPQPIRPQLPGAALAERNWRMLIDGKLVPAKSGSTYITVNPATEEVLCAVPDAGEADLAAAFEAGNRAFQKWKRETP